MESLVLTTYIPQGRWIRCINICSRANSFSRGTRGETWMGAEFSGRTPGITRHPVGSRAFVHGRQQDPNLIFCFVMFCLRITRNLQIKKALR